jgi:hypothetical protein
MKKYVLLSLVSVLLMAFSGNVFAVGLGFSGTLEYGDGNWELETQSDQTLYDDDGDVGRFGVGFVFDTAVAKDKLFNYRLNATVTGLNVELDNTGGAEAELVGLVVDNTFGFGVLRNEKVRLWVGPRVRVGFLAGDTDDFDINGESDVAVFEFGVGGAFGANFHVGPTVSLGLETGVMLSGYAGEIEGTTLGDLDVTGGSLGFFLNGVVLFRLGDDR